MRRTTDSVYEIQTRDGTIWTYRRGILISIKAASAEPLAVECLGTTISTIRRGPNGAPVFQVAFSPEFFPEQIVVDGLPRAFLFWNSDGVLRTWSELRGPSVSFEYNNGLLTSVRTEGKNQISVEWETNSGWGRGDSLWPSQHRLTRFDNELYSTQITAQGISIRARLKLGNETSVVYNPYRRIVDVSNEQEHRQFRLE